ncbi:hypothetical protein BUALT_Bualt11G0106800 [Buddleja alternifolia]|uniref:Uncharacterized protein n=1 Tax=Buddleja alternifolia TaxID=168488 RepID=A0AAV6X4X4_9LAMI|nr:hypothetical protein BUALT_Bualt11G0106800 [Buddleja alternifolia]
MAKKIMVILFFILLLMGAGEMAFGFSVNRKLMVDVERKEGVNMAAPAAATKSSAVDVAASAAAADVDLNNHHNIPRESWDRGQNPNGPADVVQDNDGNYAGNHG